MLKASSREINITEGVIWRQILYFFFPILLGTFFQQLYNTADAVIVGQFVGKEALAAVGGTTSTLINFLVNLFVGLASGSTVIISQFYGAGRVKEVRQAVHTSIALALVAGACIMVIGVIGSPFALKGMSTPKDILPHAITYLRVYFIGIIPGFIYNMGAGILRAVGDTKRPLYFLIIACLTNIVLDLLFVVVFKWGVFGVAIATMISQCVSAIFIILALIKPGTIYQLTIKEIRFSPSILKKIVWVGAPAGLQSDMYAISNILIQFSINKFPTDNIAAWTAFGKIDGFFWMVIAAYGISVTTFSGQNFGAQKYHRIRQGVKVSALMAFITSIIISTLVCIFSAPLLRIFLTDDNALQLGIKYAYLMAPFYFTYIGVEIFSGTIRGTGDSLVPMLLTGGGICLLRILWLFIVLPTHNQFETIVISYPLTWAVTSGLFFIYYLRGNWLKRSILKHGLAPEERILTSHKSK